MWWIFYVHFTTGTSIIYPYRQRTKTETSSHLKIWYNQKLNLTQLNFIPKNAKRHSSKRTRIDSQISIYGCLLAPTSFISHSTSFLHVINNIIRFIIRTHSLTQKNSMSRRAFTSKNHVKSWELLIVPKREILNSYNQNQTEPNQTEQNQPEWCCFLLSHFIKILWLQKFCTPGKKRDGQIEMMQQPICLSLELRILFPSLSASMRVPNEKKTHTD